MNIVFYRNKSDGKIRFCHEVPESTIPSDNLQKRIEEYNRYSDKDTAEVFRTEPGSFEEYLWNLSQKAKSLRAETLNDLLHDLSSAECLVIELLNQMEQGEQT